MASIAGVVGDGKRAQVDQMLAKIAHRGPNGIKLIIGRGATQGAVLTRNSGGSAATTLKRKTVWDSSLLPVPEPDALQKQKPRSAYRER